MSQVITQIYTLLNIYYFCNWDCNNHNNHNLKHIKDTKKNAIYRHTTTKKEYSLSFPLFDIVKSILAKIKKINSKILLRISLQVLVSHIQSSQNSHILIKCLLIFSFFNKIIIKYLIKTY